MNTVINSTACGGCHSSSLQIFDRRRSFGVGPSGRSKLMHVAGRLFYWLTVGRSTNQSVFLFCYWGISRGFAKYGALFGLGTLDCFELDGMDERSMKTCQFMLKINVEKFTTKCDFKKQAPLKLAIQNKTVKNN